MRQVLIRYNIPEVATVHITPPPPLIPEATILPITNVLTYM